MNSDLRILTKIFRTRDSIEQLLIKDIKTYGLTINSFGVLEYLFHHGKHHIQEVCKKLLVANSSMTYVVTQLEKKGLIMRIISSEDRRNINIELTKKGKQLMQEIFPKHQLLIEKLLEDITVQEKEMLGNILKKIGYKAIEMVGAYDDPSIH